MIDGAFVAAVSVNTLDLTGSNSLPLTTAVATISSFSFKVKPSGTFATNSVGFSGFGTATSSLPFTVNFTLFVPSGAWTLICLLFV